MQDSRALVSADCGSDHQLVWAKIVGRAWSRKIKPKKHLRKQLDFLKTSEGAASFEKQLQEELAGKPKDWSTFKVAINDTAQKACTSHTSWKSPWMNSECWEIIQKRQEEKKRGGFQSEMYHKLCKQVSKTCRRAKREYLNTKAKEAQEAFLTGKTKKVFQLVKEISGKRGT